MRPPPDGRRARDRGDDGGVWIVTGVVLGAVVYAGAVTMLVAGFTPVAPLVVIPPVLLALIGANSLIGGARRPGRAPGPMEPVPSTAEEPGEPR